VVAAADQISYTKLNSAGRCHERWVHCRSCERLSRERQRTCPQTFPSATPARISWIEKGGRRKTQQLGWSFIARFLRTATTFAAAEPSVNAYRASTRTLKRRSDTRLRGRSWLADSHPGSAPRIVRASKVRFGRAGNAHPYLVIASIFKTGRVKADRTRSRMSPGRTHLPDNIYKALGLLKRPTGSPHSSARSEGRFTPI